MADPLSFYIADSASMGTNVASGFMARVTKYTNASLTLRLNAPGSCALTIEADTSTAAQQAIYPIKNCILVYRNGFLVWSGPIWTVDEVHSGSNNKISITAVGWSELLDHRIIRTIPGYGLGTSSLTFTNGTFESALSGWTAGNTTITRDTVVFRSGAGSWKMAANIATPGMGYLYSGYANALSGTPTGGRKYRLNFYARARKDARFVNNSVPPYLEVLEGAVRVAYLDLSNLFSAGTHFVSTAGSFSLSTTELETSWASTGAFQSNSIEWVSSGVAPTFNFAWSAAPPQVDGATAGSGMTRGTSASGGYWAANTSYVSNPAVYSDGAHLYIVMSQANFIIDCRIASWNGEFDTTKTYTCTVNFDQPNGYVESGAGEFQIWNAAGTAGAIGAKLGGSGGLTFTNGTTVASFNFTPASNPLWFRITAEYDGAPLFAVVTRINSILISEVGTDTDNLLNVDDVTLQEYIGDGIYMNLDAGQIAVNLLNKANSDGATKITPGSVETTQSRTRTYQRFSNIGKEIKALSDIEAGYDYIIDPATRSMNIYNRTNATNFPSTNSSGNAGTGAWIYSADRTPYLSFDYMGGRANLSSIRRTQDGSTVVNRLNVSGKYAIGFAQDTSAQTTYGIFEDSTSLPDVIDATNSVLPAYANVEVAFRKFPKTLYDVQFENGNPNVPQLFIDFNIGDKALFGISGNALMYNQTNPITVRIFGIQMNVDDNGQETLTGLQLAL